MLIYFGILAGILSAVAFLPYMIDTLLGRTQPHRAGWFIWTVLSNISLWSQVYEGASASLWFAGTQAGATTAIFLLSLVRGEGNAIGRGDIWILLASATGLGLWVLTDSAAYALGISITISLLGGVATVIKSYHRPESETVSTWITCFIASLFAILAVGEVNWLMLAYPLYLLVLNGAIVLAISLGRWEQRATVSARLHTPWRDLPHPGQM